MPRTRGFLTISLVMSLCLANSALLCSAGRSTSTNKSAAQARRSQRLANDISRLGCTSSSPSLRMVKYLDRICEDCYLLYRDPDIYQMCRSGCFSNNFLSGCMDVIMVSKSTRSKAAHFVSLLNGHTT